MIWIVTDQHDTAGALTRLIQDKGYAVTTMTCAADVPGRARFREPKVVIVDCGLTGSYEMLRQIRKDHDSREIALVMFALADMDCRPQALAAGADAFVPRGSLDWHELLGEIQKFAGPAQGQ